MRSVRPLLVGTLALTLVGLTPAASARTSSSASPVESLVASCPSAADVAAIRFDFALSFEGDPTAGTLVCHAADGSADLTRLQERAIQALRVAKALSFTRQLPWTSNGLYDWLRGAIDGTRFRSDIAVSFCCDPPGVVDVQTRNFAALTTQRWGDPRFGVGLGDLVVLIAHEARHNEGKPHTCGASDQTLSELGAWGVQYELWLWMALYSGRFLDAPDPYPAFYRDAALANAEDMTRSRFCSIPTADLSVVGQAAPDPVVAGQTLTYKATVENHGPDTARNTYFEAEIPAGTSLLSASSPGGSCTGTGPVACSLGDLAVGSRASATIVLKVEGSAADVGAITNRPFASARGSTVIAEARDPNPGDNTAGLRAAVDASKPSARCPGFPGEGHVIRGTAGNDRLVGTKGRDVICGLGGDDLLIGRGGSDVLLGGSGNDTLDARDGARDLVNGGPGHDRARIDPKLDRVVSVESRLG